jgi:hypothetical protein
VDGTLSAEGGERDREVGLGDWLLYMYCICHVALGSLDEGPTGKQHSTREDGTTCLLPGKVTLRTVHYRQGIGPMTAKGCRGKRTAQAAKGDARLIARNQGRDWAASSEPTQLSGREV